MQAGVWIQAASQAIMRLWEVCKNVINFVGRTQQTDARSQAFREVIADLNLLNRDTEQDFLKIGGKLTDFMEAAKLMSDELRALADLVSGDSGVRESEALTVVLSRALTMGAQAADGNAALTSIRIHADHLKATLAGFKGTVSTFRTLGSLTRIETARLGKTGSSFGNLADDIRALAESVQSKVEKSLETVAVLVGRIERALETASKLEAGQAQDLGSVVSKIQASLASFRELQNHAHDSAARLAKRYEGVTESLQAMVMSIQFHDITRQQIEHVVEALGGLIPKSGASRGDALDSRTTRAVVSLQLLQLADATQKFTGSVTSIETGLGNISSHICGMADESRTLSGLSADDSNSFFLELEQGCGAILATLTRCASGEASAREATGGLSETLGRMRGTIADLQATEVLMQRTGLNASIRAAHIGSEGDALSLLATSIQQLSTDSTERSESLVHSLASMTHAFANRFTGSIQTGDDGLEEMRRAVEELHSSSERSFSQISKVVECGTCLRNDLLATRKSFSAGVLFTETVARAQRMLEPFTGERPGAGPETLRLADLAGHYTMQAERDVHEGVLRQEGTAPAIDSANPQQVSAASEEFGDNVELF